MTEKGKTRARSKKKASVEAPEVLSLRYSLAELPSAQHRAGLAGLVLMVRWLERQPERRGKCSIHSLTEMGLVLELDLAGLEQLLDLTYEATLEEEETSTPWKDKEPLRVFTREETDAKGKTKSKTMYVYPKVVPSGAFLVEHDGAAGGEQGGVWTRLWRRMLWETFRGVPATRAPFEERAKKKPCGLANKVWESLVAPEDHSLELPSTYFLGAQAQSADGVQFFDRARHQLLLHFWPFVASIYVPAYIKPTDGKWDYVPYAIVVPDVARLDTFCGELQYVFANREQEAIGKTLPKAAVVDLALEGALDMARRLRERLSVLEGERATHDLVVGFEVHHVSKEGNNVRVLSSQRFEPKATEIDEYSTLRRAFWDPPFRQNWLKNLIARRERHRGFDRIIATSPYKTMTFGSNKFRHDARKYFEIMAEHEANMKEGTANAKDNSLEAIVLAAVQAYVYGKLNSKYGLEWQKAKGTPKQREYEEKKEKIAKDAFLAVRARPNDDFVTYFAGTICSVPQWLGQDRYARLSHALYQDPSKVRTLTLLALSATAWSSAASNPKEP